MCFPCWTYEDVYFEERPKPHKMKKHPHTGTVYGYYAPAPMVPQTVPIPRPVVPVLLPIRASTASAPSTAAGYPAGLQYEGQAANRQWSTSAYAPFNSGQGNAWGPYQCTWPGQSRAQQEAMIHARSDNRPQDMVPSDPDPWRFYTVKELDGGTTSRNRYTIDSGEIGKVRWYQTREGVFYAVIIPDTKAA